MNSFVLAVIAIVCGIVGMTLCGVQIGINVERRREQYKLMLHEREKKW